MQYRDKILELLNTDDATFLGWITSHSHLDQVEIVKEYAEVLQELFKEKGEEPPEGMIENLYQNASVFQEKILDVHFTSLQYDLAIADRDKNIDAFYSDIDFVRQQFKQNIALGVETEEAVKHQASGIIDYEKKRGLYNPVNWIGLE